MSISEFNSLIAVQKDLLMLIQEFGLEGSVTVVMC